jgi:hypothetical protein
MCERPFGHQLNGLQCTAQATLPWRLPDSHACNADSSVLCCCCLYGCRSVQKALELFADWRAAHRTSHLDRSSRAFRFLVTRKQEKVLFKVGLCCCRREGTHTDDTQGSMCRLQTVQLTSNSATTCLLPAQVIAASALIITEARQLKGQQV